MDACGMPGVAGRPSCVTFANPSVTAAPCHLPLVPKGGFWTVLLHIGVALPKGSPLRKGAHEARALCAEQREVSPMKQGVPQASSRASEAAKRLESRGHGAKRSPQGRNTAQALAQGGAKVWDDHAELWNAGGVSRLRGCLSPSASENCRDRRVLTRFLSCTNPHDVV